MATALPTPEEIERIKQTFPTEEAFQQWQQSGMPLRTTQEYGRAKGPSYPRPERPAVEFTINPNYGVLGSPDLRINVPEYKFTADTPKQEADRRSLLYGLKTLPFYFSKFTEPLAIGVDIAEGILTRDPVQTATAGILAQTMNPKYQKLIAAGSVFMPFDAEAVKLAGLPELFSGVVEKIKGAPSKARGEEIKQKPEQWMGGMLKGGSTLKVNNIEIPIKTSEVENMMRLIKNNKLDDKLLTRDEMVKILEDQYYTSFISEKTSPAYFNRLGNMEVTKIELPKDGNVPSRDLLEIANYLTRDAGVHHNGEQGIISHSLIKKDTNFGSDIDTRTINYEITEIQSDMASDAHKFGIFGSPKNNMYQDLKQSYKDMRGERNIYLDLNPAGGNLNLPDLNTIFLPSKRSKIIELYGKGDAVGGGNAVDSYAAAVFNNYKGALKEVDSLYTDEYLGKLYDLSTDKLFKNKYEKEEFIDLTRKNMKDRIVNSLDSGEPNGANIIEILDMTARGYTTSPRSLYSPVYNALQKKVNDLHPSYNRDDYNTLGFNSEQKEVYDVFIQQERAVRDFDTLSIANPINQGSVPAQTPLMKNLDYVEFEIKKHLVKAANEDASRFILPGEEPVRYWSNRGQNEQFLNTIYSLVPDSKKGYKGKIGQVLTKISKKYNIPFRLDGTTGYSEQSINNIFKKDLNGVRNLSDLSGEDAMNAADFVGNPLDEVLYGGTVQMRNRVRDFQDDFKEDWLQRNYYEEEPDPEAFSRAVDQANDEFKKQVIEDPSILVDRLDLLNVYDWDGISKGFEAMAKGSEFKDVRLASEMLGKIAERTREIFDYSLQSIKEHETLGIGDVNNLGDFFRNLVQDSNKIAKDEFMRNLSQSKKAELLELGVLSIENGRFIVELPDTVKEQIIEQGFPITGL